MKPSIAIGVDLGAVNIKLILMAPSGRMIETHSLPTLGQPRQTLWQLLKRVERRFNTPQGESIKAAFTGNGQVLLEKSNDIIFVNELVAVAQASARLLPDLQSVIEIGGNASRWMLLEGGRLIDFSINDICAAGSGTFLSQQAGRLQLSLEQMDLQAMSAKEGAVIAGRCSVFAKSDMIHLQQKGTPLSAIAYGLCLAMARNFRATVLRGRICKSPVLLAGGCVASKALVRAFRDILELDDKQLVASPYPGFEAALGAALVAGKTKGNGQTWNSLNNYLQRAKRPLIHSADEGSNLSGKPRPSTKKAAALSPLVIRGNQGQDEPTLAVRGSEMAVYLGVDVGSVSTNFVLLSPEGEVLDGLYLPTRGRVIEVLNEGLNTLKGRCKERITVIGVGTTGSGRHLAAKLLGADRVHNEITCQMKSAVAYFPNVESIFEIGGQDSKYIYIKDGRLQDFTMNKVCAAGTGSFLEEQAAQLGVDIMTDFVPLCEASVNPADLGSRCTVHMESVLLAAQTRGAPIEDLTAGLAYSIARNYLEKVVADRPIGSAILFQGGVASNGAVIAAFEQILDKPIRVHPYNRISGAIGAALMAHESQPATTTAFKGFSPKKVKAVKSFECQQCPNHCQVNRLEVNRQRIHFGDTCERFTSRESRGHEGATQKIPNLAAQYDELLNQFTARPAATIKGRIGIPRASVHIHWLPFWSRFLAELGFETFLSPPSSPAILEAGLARLPAETCLPIKLAFGHVAHLDRAELDFLLLPSIVGYADDRPGGGLPCPYVQSLPFMVQAGLKTPLLAPEVNFQGNEFTFLVGGLQGPINRWSSIRAYREGRKAQALFERALLDTGKKALAERHGKGLVLMGRPYNLADGFCNLNLARHLHRLGVLAIPAAFLPLSEVPLPDNLDTLFWKMNRDVLRAVMYAMKEPGLYPVIVTNFGCGPDAFSLKHAERLLGEHPYLIVEFDEHRAEAGLITRLEAFLDELAEHPSAESPKKRPVFKPIRSRDVGITQDHLRGKRVLIPYFADHAIAISGCLQSLDINARIMPLPDEETRMLGETYSSGKECHAYSMFAGDMVKATLSSSDTRPTVYMLLGTTIPCLLHQYTDSLGILAEKLNVAHFEMIAPGHDAYVKLLGLPAVIQLYRAFYAVDLLVKAICSIRPYEREKGRTDAVHKENLAIMEQAIAERRIHHGLAKCLDRLKDIPVDRSGKRFLVGITGDIYTRTNHAANFDLFHTLENMGCEIWPAPFEVDIIDFNLPKDFLTSLYDLRLTDALEDGFLVAVRELEAFRMSKIFRSRMLLREEPGYFKVRKLATEFIGEKNNELLILNTAKLRAFADGGAQGIINVICFNCMLGTVSSSTISSIRARHGQIPVTTLVYSGAEDSTLQTRLEAFIHQIGEYY